MSRYSSYAQAIYESGLGDPLPISSKHKGPLVAGHHGERGRRMTQSDVDAYIKRYGNGKVNIGVRLADNIIGIDVDAHSGKKGAKSLKKLIKRYGPLPDTWVSTSRDFPNGIHLYRLPDKYAGAEFPASVAGMPDIDLVSWRDMYVQCAPSVHPKTGKEYRWEHTGTGVVQTSPPSVKDIPKLPKRWRKVIVPSESHEDAFLGLEAFGPATDSVAIAKSDEDAVAYAVGVLEGTEDLRGEHSSRHKAIAAMVLRLTFNENDEAIAEIERAWFENMTSERGAKEARREWKNIVKSARQRADEPSPPAREAYDLVKTEMSKAVVNAKIAADFNGVELDELDDTSFPVDALPVRMQAYARTFAERRQVPVGIVAPAMLAALSAATAGGIVAMAPDGYEYGTALYYIGIADPSERKSTVLSAVITKPLIAAQSEYAAAHSVEYKAALVQLKSIEKRIRAMENGKDDIDADALIHALTIQESLEAEVRRLRPPNIAVADTTPEALEKSMELNNGVALLATAEGDFIENLSGRYGGNASLASVNKAWSREALITRRVTREDVTVPVAHLAIATLVQDTVAERLGQEKFEQTGALSRFLINRPVSKVGERDMVTKKLPDDLSGWWYATVAAVLNRGWGKIETPEKIVLEPKAIELLTLFFQKAEAHAAAHDGVLGWWAKSVEMVVRIAALMTLAENPDAVEIPAEKVHGAITIVEYFADAMEDFFDKVIDPVIGAANEKLRKRILKHIERHYRAGDTFTSAQVARALSSSEYRVDTDLVSYILALLEMEGVLKELPTKRADSRKWEVLAVDDEPVSEHLRQDASEKRDQLRRDALRDSIFAAVYEHYSPGDVFTLSAFRAAHFNKTNRPSKTAVKRVMDTLVTRGYLATEPTKRRDSLAWRVLGVETAEPSLDTIAASALKIATSPLDHGSEHQRKSSPGTPANTAKDASLERRVGKVGGAYIRIDHISTTLSFSSDFGVSFCMTPKISNSVQTPDRCLTAYDLAWELDGETYPIHIYTPARHSEYLAFLNANHTLGFDTETTGLRMLSGDTIRLAQFASETEAWVIDAQAHPAVIKQTFTIVPRFYAHNAMFDNIVVAEHIGVDLNLLNAKVVDTQILAHLIDPRTASDGGVGHGLKALSDAYLKTGASDSDVELKAEAKRLGIKVGNRFAHIPLDNEPYLRYAGADAILVRKIGDVLIAMFAEREINQLPSIIPDDIPVTDEPEEVFTTEQRIAAATTRMKFHGIKIDRDAALRLHDKLSLAEAEAMDALREHGVTSPNKNAAVIEALQNEGVYKLTQRTAKGALSVNSAVLDEAMEAGSEVARLVTDAKKYKRYRTVYVDGMLAYTDDDDLLHPDIRALRAVTGRMAISDPPLQQIPADMQEVRNLFIPSKPKMRIVSADFSQIEARVLAALAGDEAFYEDVVHGDKADGTDIHSVVARMAFGEDYTEHDRTTAKRIVFGKLYGGGVATLARQSGVSSEIVTGIVKAFNERYRGVRSYERKLQTQVAVYGGFFLPSGRLVRLDTDGSYRALNYMIQGTARDLFVNAVLRLEDAGYGDNLLLPVHDEMLLELPARGIKESVQRVADTMSDTFGGVELPVGVGYGKSWGKADH